MAKYRIKEIKYIGSTVRPLYIPQRRLLGCLWWINWDRHRSFCFKDLEYAMEFIRAELTHGIFKCKVIFHEVHSAS